MALQPNWHAYVCSDAQLTSRFTECKSGITLWGGESYRVTVNYVYGAGAARRDDTY